MVFWSDMNLGHIMYSQLDGRYHAFLLRGLVRPKSLAIDPVDGSVRLAVYVGLMLMCCNMMLLWKKSSQDDEKLDRNDCRILCLSLI